MSTPARILFGLVLAYRLLLSPVLPRACRYQPTCSTYALDALRRFGAWRGTLLAIGRICRCHPWGGAGFDPVPERAAMLAGSGCRPAAAQPSGTRRMSVANARE